MKDRILVTGGSGFIGTHFIDLLMDLKVDILNIDVRKPQKKEQAAFWRECNILNLDELSLIFAEFKPSLVVHLAARATTEGRSLDDFVDNTVGTSNVVEAVNRTPGISRLVVASSQHVRKPGSGLPKHDQDYAPHGLYGQSKVLTEQIVHKAGLHCVWTIIRPTTVWGPLHPFLPGGLWKMMRKGLYFHPLGDQVVRSYGYVKNVAWQIWQILCANPDLVDGKVYYVADGLMPQIEWIDQFSLALTKKRAIRVPRIFVLILAKIGDLLGILGFKFPMDTSRYFNLTTTNPVPDENIITVFGRPPYSLFEGIMETKIWMDDMEDERVNS